MAFKHRKKLLAIEWSWLLIGAAVVLTFTIEGWAAPYVPVLWMLGMLGLFFAYRFAITLYEINWPEPELTPAEAAEEMKRHGGDGIAGTVVYALPQMRGRSVPQDRDRKRAEAASKLELPSPEGVFEDDNLDTILGIPAEDGETPTDEAIPQLRRRVGRPGLFGVMVYEDEELRPETEADVTGTEIPIPSFAESKLTSLERERALKEQSDRTLDRSNTAKTDPTKRALNTKRAPARPTKPAESLKPHEMTHVDRPAHRSKVVREATKVERKTLDEIAHSKSKLDEMKLDEMKLDEMKLDEMKLDEMKEEQIKLDELLLEEEVLLEDEIYLEEETLQSKTPDAHRADQSRNEGAS